MTEVSEQNKRSAIRLPEQLIGMTDLSRMIRELEALNDSLYQASIRTSGAPTQVAKTSRTLEELSSLNGLSLLENGSRQHLLDELNKFAKAAPRIHVSFASEPSTAFSREIAVWFRKNVNEHLLIDIGLQPYITIGCSVRTYNRIFDMSLRNRFDEKKGLLLQKINEITRHE